MDSPMTSPSERVPTTQGVGGVDQLIQEIANLNEIAEGFRQIRLVFLGMKKAGWKAKWIQAYFSGIQWPGISQVCRQWIEEEL